MKKLHSHGNFSYWLPSFKTRIRILLAGDSIKSTADINFDCNVAASLAIPL